jgi:hypothetical protein
VDAITHSRALGGNQLITDRGVSALLTNLRNKVPLVLIIGNKCRVSPVFMRGREVDVCRVLFLDGIVSWIGFG